MDAALRPIRLSRRARRGDPAAFEQIFRRHSAELYRYCLAIVRDPEDAEDALQGTMAAALRSLPGEERDLELRPWLFRVARNESISIIRRRRPHDSAGEVEIPEPDGVSQDERLLMRERLRNLISDLGGLRERQRSALVMRELSGLSNREIGVALGCSEVAARQAVFEARTALRDLEEGRSMECEEAREAISARDGRRLRGRRLRAHVDGCAGCTAFAVSITQRQEDLAALFPALPAAVSASIVGGLLGGSGGGMGAGAAGLAGGGIAGSVAVKAASVTAAIAIAAGAADVGGLIDLPRPGGAKEGVTEPVNASAPEPAGVSSAVGAADGPTSATSSEAGTGGGDPGPSGGRGRDGDRSSDGGRGRDDGRGQGDVRGDSSGAGAGTGSATESPAEPPAAGATESPGNSSTAPGQTGTAPGGGTTEAPGQTGVLPGSAADAPGHSSTSNGNSANAPGQTGAAPPGQVSNPSEANSNGHSK